ncbi:MAG: hypothetical protein HY922_06200 [Elusimicrobia bacterium]|nr:hypothetical protein [Elusimicrobiota bacterium]
MIQVMPRHSEIISRRVMLLVLFACVLSGFLVFEAKAHSETKETLDSNPACARIRTNAALSVTASTRSLNITLVNNDQVPLWVPQTEDTYRIGAKTRVTTIWYGYFQEAYPGHISLHYVIEPMRKIGPKQTNHWTFTPSPGAPFDSLVPGFLVRVRMRVALKAFASEGRAGMKRLNALLAESCVIETSARMPSK